MPRAKKTEKFYISKVPGHKKYGTHLVRINRLYEGSENLTFQELVDFLKEQGLDPAKVKLPASFCVLFVTK